MHKDTIYNYCAQVKKFRSFSEINYFLVRLCSELQADFYVWSYGDGNGLFINYDNRPSNWMTIYDNKSWLFLDPIVQTVMSDPGSFRWDEVLNTRIKLSATQKLIMGQAAEIGMKNGFVFPNAGPGTVKSSLSFISKNYDYPISVILECEIHLSALSIQLHNQARKIHMLNKNRTAPVLSEREKEVMNFSAEGFSIIETAEKLGLGQSTIKKHRESAMLKLGANNIAHAVSLAIHHKLIFPMHLQLEHEDS